MKRYLFIFVFIFYLLFFGVSQVKAEWLVESDIWIDDPKDYYGVCTCVIAYIKRDFSYDVNKKKVYESMFSMLETLEDRSRIFLYEYFLTLNAKSGLCKINEKKTNKSNDYFTNKDASSFCTFKPIKKPMCCCKNLEVGSNTVKRECVSIHAAYGDFACVEELKKQNYKNPGDYRNFPMPSDDSCSSLEQGVTKDFNTKGDVYSFSTDELQALANKKLNKLGTGSLTDLISKFINFLIAPIGSFALVLYVYAGILWMTAAGSSEKITKAKQVVVWTSLGLFVVLSSYLIVKAVFDFLTGLS